MRTIRFIPREKTATELEALVPPPVSFAGEPADPAATARHYLAQVLDLDRGADVSFSIAAEPPTTTTLANVQASALTDSSVVRFTQTVASIPIFGSHIVVEVKDEQLVAVDAEVASVAQVSPVPTLDAAAAAARIVAYTGASIDALGSIEPPSLTFYLDEGDEARWHLAWSFIDVPVAPAGFRDPHPHKGHRGSPRRRHALLGYLVDAHDGEVLFHYSRTPGARPKRSGPPPIPVKCRGRDVQATEQELFGVAAPGGFELYDPLQGTRTFDLAGGDTAVDTTLPPHPVRSASADFGSASPAAISAHVNVGRVLDFFRSVLKRDSIDDEGMEVVSVVNCVDSESEDPPQWANATWWRGKMWFGQERDASGTLASYAAYLDIVGHELMHGVIDHTAALVYKNQSGALNESFADILGMIIVNWYRVGPDSDVRKWTWEFLPGLGGNGKPVRDLGNPKRTGDPEHMRDFLRTRDDDGGVHTNSNIHNKAAYNVLTAVDASGAPAITPRDAAILYYMCLMRLPQTATFTKTLAVLLDVAAMYYSGEPALAERKLAAIRKAYAKVGIEQSGAASGSR